jgi:hypothetical protein
MAVDKFRPDRYDLIGPARCLLGVVVIRYVHARGRPRSASYQANPNVDVHMKQITAMQ